MGTHFPLGSARLWRPSAGAGEGMSALVCALSGEVPSEPVVSIKSGHLFEKKLITKYVEVLHPLPRYDGSHAAPVRAPRLSSAAPSMCGPRAGRRHLHPWSLASARSPRARIPPLALVVGAREDPGGVRACVRACKCVAGGTARASLCV